MYKAMIVEDEMLVRIGIRNVIKWDALGITLTEDAENGAQALDVYKRQLQHIKIRKRLQVICKISCIIPDIKLITYFTPALQILSKASASLYLLSSGGNRFPTFR